MPPDLKHVPKKFGVTVRHARTGARLTQMALAEKADLTLNYVGEIERGEKLASIETAAKLGYALGVSGAELMKKAGL